MMYLRIMLYTYWTPLDTGILHRKRHQTSVAQITLGVRRFRCF